MPDQRNKLDLYLRPGERPEDVPTLQNPELSLREQLEYGLTGLMGDDRTAARRARGLTSLSDYIPVLGDVTGVDEGLRATEGGLAQLGRGEVLPGAGNAALGLGTTVLSALPFLPAARVAPVREMGESFMRHMKDDNAQAMSPNFSRLNTVVDAHDKTLPLMFDWASYDPSTIEMLQDRVSKASKATRALAADGGQFYWPDKSRALGNEYAAIPARNEFERLARDATVDLTKGKYDQAADKLDELWGRLHTEPTDNIFNQTLEETPIFRHIEQDQWRDPSGAKLSWLDMDPSWKKTAWSDFLQTKAGGRDIDSWIDNFGGYENREVRRSVLSDPDLLSGPSSNELPFPVRNSLEFYGSSGYRDINGWLRQRPLLAAQQIAAGIDRSPAGASKWADLHHNMGSTMRKVEDLDGLFSQSRTTVPLITVRGGRGWDRLPWEDLVGEKFTRADFVSTSLNPEVATGFGKFDAGYSGYGKDTGINWVINVPPDSKAVSVSRAIDFGHEEEVLLPRNSEFEIADVDPESHTVILNYLGDKPDAD